MIEKKIITTVYEYDSISEIDETSRLLIKKASEIVNNSYAPYSHFKVGAAVILENEEIITGANQENAAYPSGLCAERVALFYANAQFPNIPVVALAVVAKSNNKLTEQAVSPCGACRQVILETENRFKRPIKIILAGNSKIKIIDNAQSLLPLNFDDGFLKK